MTNHTARLYALVGTALVLFLSWAVIAAHPWKKAAAADTGDARLVALAQREQLLRKDLALVQRIATRAAAVRAQSQLAAVRTPGTAATAATAAATPAPAAPAAAPRVRVVTLPPLVITRSS